ncbi:MAG: TIGR04282 family arsenosugar biosynthesis glycosyltransferase [Cellvibrionaceae bacterium]|nr:TIGR04282 family arsenosugar biosynthesis glycosyltransferase [Cellvibrionaceae bacterium]
MYAYPQYLLQVFSKSPELGKVKTRLQPAYCQSFSLDLHSRLVNYCLQQWVCAGVCPVALAIAGHVQHFKSQFPQWQQLHCQPQWGEDLGQRMCLAVDVGLQKTAVEGVLLVGTDCPFIDSAYLQAACSALAVCDIVIGPARDGGYVLLGMKQLHPELFQGIDWGHSSVFEQTLKKVQRLSLAYKILGAQADIDRPEDLSLLAALEGFQDLF